ncbi:M1 family metallopeptidase [Cyclobacterium jeungdonense]|uniref:M1 family metallopeptidase n=1 Tax=Cyclobacterium jeungdonense TaxID=708087 RepID=A0ABT8C6U9_9BACT|nr:M1 family metallopeptidase [Cyclobacterium jeungdonense]MDN3687358.1 M1 family metallopeptidase [Cyclobacterium jeungdonense]
MKKHTFFFIWGLFLAFSSYDSHAQSTRWQQSINYQMEVDMDVSTNRYRGNQIIAYSNHSPDTLHQVFFHLYYNAFQPNSMMDERSRTIADPDRRVGERIFNLSPEEIGYMRVTSLQMNGQPVSMEEVGSVLEVSLQEPILPNSTVIFESEFEAQVPLQVRRSGRDNAEGIRYSMAQWYPKLANYDEQGWHANPYIGREFYGTWGNFDVKITIDKDYVLGGTGYLQNANEIGHGYEAPGESINQNSESRLTWHFYAPQVHDFMWAANPDFTHDKLVMDNGITLHFLYEKNSKTEKNWAALPEYTRKAMNFFSEHYGQYPYQQFSVIQGGDGGMEYPMSTLITGQRTLGSLVGVTVHELAHSWFQGVLGSNESLYPWMDEGFTTFASNRCMAAIFSEDPSGFPQFGAYASYEKLAKSGLEEPMATHADHYHTNTAYGVAAYSKGALFLAQMGYIIGEEVRDEAMLQYWNEWKFKHPNANDITRIMEKASGLELDWFKEYWIYTTKSIDYSISSVSEENGKTKVILERKGMMPMPIDFVVTYIGGKQETIYLPLTIMRGNKPEEAGFPERVRTQRWPWTRTSTEVILDEPLSAIQSLSIDPSLRLADINRGDNDWTRE